MRKQWIPGSLFLPRIWLEPLGGGAAAVAAAAVDAVAAVVYEEILLHSVHGATADDNVMPYETPTVLNQNSAYEKSTPTLVWSEQALVLVLKHIVAESYIMNKEGRLTKIHGEGCRSKKTFFQICSFFWSGRVN